MDAKSFYQEFVKAMAGGNLWTDGQGREHTYWEMYRGGIGPFTEMVNKHVIHSILERGGYKVQHEYYRVDTIGWDGPGYDGESYGLGKYTWDLLAAVEHENDETAWMDELMKLMHLRCPLKVVISYNYCGQRDTDLEKLALAAGWMKEAAAYAPDSGEEYLVILGNCQGRDGADYDSFDYRGYVYSWESGEFQTLTDFS